MDTGRIAGLLVPARCVICRLAAEPGAALCGKCMRALNGSRVIRREPPEGIDRIASCADHDGVARDLLAAFKFRQVTGLAGLIAGFMADAAGPVDERGLVVPVPPARLRTWLRGFDPVALLAGQVASRIGTPIAGEPILERFGSGRQRGRSRSGRLADPPDIRPAAEAGQTAGGRPVLLVDDVMTTGATLATAAAALRLAGASPVFALTFTRRL